MTTARVAGIDVPVSFSLVADEALAFFKAKGLRASFVWKELLRAEHVASFTVAKMMDLDMLADVQESLAQALQDGQSFDAWKRTIRVELQRKGWWGTRDVVDPATGATVRAQLGSPARLETIFRTNIQTAYSAGQWQKIQEQKQTFPFLMYDAVDDFRTRPEHAAWDGRVARVNDSFWQDHYPPNGWNCRCTVISLDEDDLAELGISESEPYEGGTYEWQNPRTGSIEQIPNGIDPGFDYNPGKARLEEIDRLAAEKAASYPQDLQSSASKGLSKAKDDSTRPSF